MAPLRVLLFAILIVLVPRTIIILLLLVSTTSAMPRAITMGPILPALVGGAILPTTILMTPVVVKAVTIH